MKKKILINAKLPEEKRIAIVEGDRLVDFYAEISTKEHLKGNIYKGIISSVEPSLQAVFVDFGANKNGFLPKSEIMPEYFRISSESERKGIQEIFSKGQEILVQVDKDERDTKGASLTSYISLPGRYIVMMPGQGRIRISRKIEEEEERERLKDIFNSLKLPMNTGFILRTACIGISITELSNDLKYLERLWDKIQREAKNAKAPALIYKEQDIVVRTVRDYLTSEIDEVLVDEPNARRSINSFLRLTLPWRKINIKYYKEKRPIFDLYNIEEQVTKLNDRYVRLPSKGYLVFDKTEALTSIDVNSGRSRKEKNIEQTALKTNLEAADEIARQLRLRDIGGLIVIDFIDMESPKNRREVEERLKSALKNDKAHSDIAPISKFGLLEMTRERMRTAYFESAYKKCEVCEGSGLIKADEILALNAFREIHTRISKEHPSEISCNLPVASANYLINFKRDEIIDMEKEYKVKINVISDPNIKSGQYLIKSTTIST